MIGEAGMPRRPSGLFLKSGFGFFFFPFWARSPFRGGGRRAGFSTGLFPPGGARLPGSAAFSYSHAGSKSRLQFDGSHRAQSVGGMSGSNSSTGPAQGRSTNARHSQKSSLRLPRSLSRVQASGFRGPRGLRSGGFQNVVPP